MRLAKKFDDGEMNLPEDKENLKLPGVKSSLVKKFRVDKAENKAP